MESLLDRLLQYLRHQRLLMDYMLVSAVAAFIYDYILVLHLEIRLIWFSRWSYTKVFYLIIRYIPFISLVLALHNQMSLDPSLKTCKRTYPVEIWLTLLEVTFVEIVLCIRTWAVWNRSRIIGIGLAILIFGDLIVQCFLVNKFVVSMEYSPALYPGFRGCFVTHANRALWTNYTLLTIVDAVVLVLMGISAFRSYRRSNISKLTLIVHRDGILFYIYLLGISIANVVTTATFPLDLMILLSPLGSALYALLTTRIVLNIRDASTQGCNKSELHTGYDDSSTVITPIQFVNFRPQDCTTPSQS